jgi:UDP-GlcNAc:undecaprenyl-phosphate GlcNAc-1-phosphate transferase
VSLATSAATAFAITPLVRNFARRHGWVDRPDGLRKLHITPVPRLGGVAVFGAFLVTCVLLIILDVSGAASGVSASAYLHLLIACTMIVAMGVMDDIADVQPAPKLLVQGLAGLYLFFNGYQVTAISNPLSGESVRLGMLSLPLTLVWFIGMSNAFNLIDGLDGLAAGVGLFSTTTLFIACVINQRWETAIIAAALGGALLGFLRYNFNPASIFLGDSGALFLGFALAAVAVRGSMKSSAAIAVAAPLMALAVPILDVTIAVLRRLVRGDHVFKADGDHIHHRLLRLGLTPKRVVGVLYAVTAAFGALSLLTMTWQSQVVGMVVLASSVVTWIGVQQLGYAEFAEIQRSLRYGIANERRSVGNNVYLASLPARLAESEDLGALWTTITEAAARLQFDRVELRVPGDRGRPLIGQCPAWEARPRSVAGASATWTVPISIGGPPVAAVVLTRTLSNATQFDASYLVTAIEQGFASRLRALLGSPGPAVGLPVTAVHPSA